MPTLVAISTSPLAPRRRSQAPIRVSDSPPWCPGTHAEYMSAVSIIRPPASTNRSRMRNASSPPAVQPKTLPPRTRRGVERPLWPRGRESGTNRILRQSGSRRLLPPCLQRVDSFLDALALPPRHDQYRPLRGDDHHVVDIESD